jgi:hypothetical protein
MELPWPEAAVVEEPTLEAQAERTAKELPVRPILVGSRADAHVGAVRELARRHGRIGLVWLDPRPDPPELPLLAAACDVVRDLPGTRAPREPLYVAVHGDSEATETLELLLAGLPRPAGAGFTGISDARRLARLGAALGL